MIIYTHVGKHKKFMCKLLNKPNTAPAFNPEKIFVILAQPIKINETKKPYVLQPKKMYSNFISGGSGQVSLNKTP